MRKIIPKKSNGMDETSLSIERYPSFYIDIEHIPEAKDWNIGDKYIITLEVKMTGISINEREGQKKERGSVDFDIKGIETDKVKKEYKLLKKGL